LARAAAVGVGAGLLLISASSPVLAGDDDRGTPSGLPVPRYVSLKFDEVNARSGPSDDHRLLWTYHVRGLPVQVVAETDEWRRICDSDGGLSWVHKRTIDGRRSVLRNAQTPAPLRDGPRPNARVSAYLAPRALASLDRCDGGWCKVKVGAVSGWIQAADVWGTNETPQCR
ncbi:MAG TPA: SH3 domain-containing protein, partial [Caulobacteraceae bacterium]|nr:SH3 domain-containing protein [Caulobacteraceae bacterium]